MEQTGITCESAGASIWHAVWGPGGWVSCLRPRERDHWDIDPTQSITPDLSTQPIRAQLIDGWIIELSLGCSRLNLRLFLFLIYLTVKSIVFCFISPCNRGPPNVCLHGSMRRQSDYTCSGDVIDYNQVQTNSFVGRSHLLPQRANTHALQILNVGWF